MLSSLSERERKLLIALAICVILLVSVFVYIFVTGSERSQSVPLPTANVTADENGFIEENDSSNDAVHTPTEIIVDVKGAVQQPGVYRLMSDMRVYDAIQMAGGTTDEADLERLNLADFLADGAAIIVPKVGEELPLELSSDGNVVGTGSSGGKVNINRATAEELQTLKGIGPSKSEAIVKDRETNGPFKSVDELTRVSGIGDKTLENIRDDITVK